MTTAQPTVETDPLSKTIRWRNVRGFVISLFIIALFFITMKFLHIELNGTASMPIGMYQRIMGPVQRGSLVSVCLPKAIATEGVQKKYLTQGGCPGNSIAVLKQVIAIPGDTISVMNKGMRVAKKFYPAPIKLTDHEGQSIKRFIPNGIYHATSGYWLYGSGDVEHSWDSRYYGSVNATNVQGVYRPLLTFSHLST